MTPMKRDNKWVLVALGAVWAALATALAFIVQDLAAWFAEVWFSLDWPAASRHAVRAEPDAS